MALAPASAPVVQRGIIRETADRTNVKLDISDVIDQLTPEEAPLFSLVGKDSLKEPCTQITHEWLQDQLRPSQGTLGAAYTVGGNITFKAGEGKYLVPDDTVMIGDAVYRLNTGVPEGDVATVTLIRGTDAAVANGAIWMKVGHSAAEGGAARTDATKTVIVKPYNYTQIIKDWCFVTGTMEVVDRYGYASERAYQEEKVLRQLTIQMERNLIYGVRSYEAGPPRKSTMGGLFEYVYLDGVAGGWDTVQNLNGAALDEATLVAWLRRLWEQGNGGYGVIMVNGFNKSRISSFAAPRIRTVQSERKAGSMIDLYECDFGTFEIMKNRYLRPGDVVMVTKDEIGIGPLVGRQFSSRELPHTSDGTWYEILGEYTMEIHKPTLCHGWLYNTATA